MGLGLVFDESAGVYNAWVGLTDEANEGTWVWTDGTTVSEYLDYD